MPETNIYFNGVDGVSGQYLVPPMDLSQAAGLVKGETLDRSVRRWLERIWQLISQPHLGLPMGVNPAEINQAGWGIVFHQDEPQAVQEALSPLVKHREAGASGGKVKVLEFRPQEDWAGWLARYGVAAGSVNPARVPYYLLLVGSPEKIPYSFESLINVEYAVGRVCFDTPDGYRSYVESLVDYERSKSVPNGKEAIFFGTRHAFDRATQLSADLLVRPLVDGVPEEAGRPAEAGIAGQYGYRALKFLKADATKANLGMVLQGEAGVNRPAFLFTASHGMGWPRGHLGQIPRQGALLCQDWPGLGAIHPDHYFAGSDLSASAQVHGLITFHFACYGAGTPQHDNFLHRPGQTPPEISDRPFVAALPKRLLAHPQGGALAVIGHIERAWGCSITHPAAGPQLQPFRNTIGRILSGVPAGHAMRDFSERYAMLSVNLSRTLEQAGFGARIPDDELAALWLERNDAQNYVLIGDPAARLRVEAMG